MTPAVRQDRKGARKNQSATGQQKTTERSNSVECRVTILNSSMGARCLEVTILAAASGRVTRLCQVCADENAS